MIDLKPGQTFCGKLMKSNYHSLSAGQCLSTPGVLLWGCPKVKNCNQIATGFRVQGQSEKEPRRTQYPEKPRAGALTRFSSGDLNLIGGELKRESLASTPWWGRKRARPQEASRGVRKHGRAAAPSAQSPAVS